MTKKQLVKVVRTETWPCFPLVAVLWISFSRPLWCFPRACFPSSYLVLNWRVWRENLCILFGCVVCFCRSLEIFLFCRRQLQRLLGKPTTEWTMEWSLHRLWVILNFIQIWNYYQQFHLREQLDITSLKHSPPLRWPPLLCKLHFIYVFLNYDVLYC